MIGGNNEQREAAFPADLRAVTIDSILKSIKKTQLITPVA